MVDTEHIEKQEEREKYNDIGRGTEQVTKLRGTICSPPNLSLSTDSRAEI